MYKKVISGICIFAVFALIAIQTRPVQHLLLNNSLIDKIISKFDNYSTLKTKFHDILVFNFTDYDQRRNLTK